MNYINEQKNKLLVIIVTYNAMKWTERCFGSLRNSSVQNDVFVVDNGSTDGTQDYIKKNYPEVKFQQSSENLGFGKANNIGLQYALDNDYDYVYLLNQDAWVMEDTFEKLIEVFQKNKEYGILSPMQMQANLNHYDRNFGYAISNWNKGVRLIEDLYFSRTVKVYECAQVMAAHWMLTKSCLTCVGGFSPSFPHYGEDGNYIDRALRQSIKVGFTPCAIAVHDREYRELTSKQIIYGSYAATIQRLSGWSYGSCFSIVTYYLLTCLQYTFRYLSLKPLHFFIKILYHLAEILRNRKKSDCNFAFLITN